MTWTMRNGDRILEAVLEHMALVGISVAIALVLSLAIGIATARRPGLFGLTLALTGVLFAIPSLALFALFIPLMGIGTAPAVAGLVLYCLMILIRNIGTGFQAIPDEVLEAARGLGYGPVRRLIEIELPLALPFIVAGVRIATVTVIGIATVAAYINAGGLGVLIFEGIDQRFLEKILVGGLLTAALALFFDVALSRIEAALSPGRRSAR